MNSGADNQFDLDLQAFRYVADEMSDDESLRFERQLADEQTAREAVARAVQVARAIALGAPLTASVSADDRATPLSAAAGRTPRFWTVAALSAAIALLAAVGLSRWIGQNASPTVPTASSSDGQKGVGIPAVKPTHSMASRMIALWSESAADFGRLADDEAVEPQAIRLRDRQNEDDSFLAAAASDSWPADDDDEFDLPSWMLAAVSADDESEPSSPEPAREN